MKTASGAILGSAFFGLGRFLLDFWVSWVPDCFLWADFRPTFATFWRTVGSHMIFLCLRVFGQAPGIELGCLGEPPGKDFGRILGYSLRHFGRSWPFVFAPILCQVWPNSGSVVVLPSVSHPCCPAFSCRGGGLAQRVKY